MKQLIVLFAAIFLMPASVYAQYGGAGVIDINAGIGVGTNLAGSGIPIGVSVGYGYTEEISVGGYAGFAHTTEDFGTGEFTYTNFIIGARGAYHKQFVDNIDTYGGAMFGYNIASAEWDGPGNAKASAGGFSYSLFVGGRYHFTPKLGAFVELGYGVSILQTGLTVRM